jgi:hypothetical protein
MGVLAMFLLLAAVKDRTPLRGGCDATDEVVAYLPAGAPVTIRYAIDGCIAVSSGELRGFLPASAIVNSEEFDRARRAAPATSSLATLPPKGKDPLALAREAREAYYSDNLQESLGLLKDSLALKEDLNVRRFLDQVEREASAGLGKGRLLSARFALRYDGSMQVEQARAMLELLEDEFTRISAEIGCHPTERMSVILQNRADYLRTSGAAEWSAGVYDGRIRVSLQDWARTRTTVSHELVHACLASTGHWPAWFHEGLAQKLSGQSVSQVRVANFPKLSQMDRTFAGLSAENASAAYAVAGKAVELFYRDYREMGIANLVRSPERLPTIAEDLDRKLRQ